MPEANSKPPRTLGISLAIILSLIAYTVIPMIRVIFTWVVRQRVRAAGFNMGGADVLGGGMLGFAGVTDTELLLRMVPALLFIAIAILAWRGKPAVIRLVMVAAVIMLTLWNMALDIWKIWQSRQIDAADGFYAESSLLAAYQPALFGFFMVVMLYTVWYLNRGPARAFFRGYYLERPAPED